MDRNAGRLARITQAASKLVEEVIKAQPEAGISKVQGALYRNGFLNLARETVRQLLRGSGHGPQTQRMKRRNKPATPKFFERANPNELWQTDIMSFMIKGQYRAYMIGFMDDHSRFIVGWGLFRMQTASHVQEVFRAAIEKHGLPKEVLSDNGRQYYSWRGKSQFTELLMKLGIRHIRSRPYHPQTCGKIESFWRNLIQECLTRAPISTFEEAQSKIGEYVEYYNFKRPHQGIGNLMPSDRFYGVASQVKQIVEANTVKMEEAPVPAPGYTPPMYLVGNIGGKELRVVAKDAEVTLKEPEKVESAAGGNNGTNETSQPAGAAGSDSTGVSPATADQGSVPAGGGVPGTVLPVDAVGAPSGAASPGGESAGSQTVPGSDGRGGPSAPGTLGPDPSGVGENTQGTRPPETGGEGGAADHPAQRMGAVPPSGV